ncbi:MAG TPA: glutamine amidotransferase [Gemmataceae bacterium]|nr:glutamine amidotransferase [Gemmataceae bacterium]
MAATNDSILLTWDPAWPWSLPGVGPRGLVLIGLLLIALTVWTYRGVRGASYQRVLVLIGIRVAALVVACLAVLRPSLAFQNELHLPSTLLIAADASESMTIQDQYNSQSRWDYLRRLLHDSEPLFQRLQDDYHFQVIPYRFAGDVGLFDPQGKADGKRTDFGEMLQSLYERHSSDRHLRGLLILSDGADNGTRYPALSVATKWRMLPCPIHTFAFGQTTTRPKQRDIAFTAIRPDPSPVAIKGKLLVKGTLDAPGFENTTVHVRLFVNDVEMPGARDFQLLKTTGNEVELLCDAPATPGEIKVTLKVDPITGEMTRINNEISTFVTVTKEGISVLYVEGKYRAWEPKFIRYALSENRNIRLFESVRLNDEPPPPGESDLFQFDRQHYDVIILGDISGRRLSAGNPRVLSAIYQQVYDKGAGLLMLGGYESFGNSDWVNTEIAKLLPVELDTAGQINTPVQMVPTFQGLRHYVLRLADNEADNKTLWSQLPKLDGMTRLGRIKPGAIVLARAGAADNADPVLVGQMFFGNGRTLAFAGDTTWKWCRSEPGTRAHARFWQQIVLWLAKRDETDGNLLVLPDTRRLAAGGKLGFGVRLRGKGGVDIPEQDAHFEVTVIDPQKNETKVPTAREHGSERGTFWKTDLPGEYVLVARGWGKDVDGKPIENLAPAKARFMIYQDEAEMARQAADHDFLTKLANAGGGKVHQAEDLRQFLKDLGAQPTPQNRPKAQLWPDWRRNPPSQALNDQLASLASSGILACFMLFVSLLCLEWFLRRYWGLV